MSIESPKKSFRSGYVAIVGRPNVGKSTLVNYYLGQVIAPVTPKPQTTQRRQLGILSLQDSQIIFMDTPGMHKPVHELGKLMIEAIVLSLEDADVVVWLVDGTEPPQKEDMLLMDYLLKLSPSTPVILAVNKMDRISSAHLAENTNLFADLIPGIDQVRISAKSGTGCQELLEKIIVHLPEGPPYFNSDQVTDLYEREIAADLIRASALVHLRDEVPYGVGVRIDEYNERGEDGAYIVATLFVERESQRGIVIGKGAQMIKNIGITARKQIENMSGRKVFLDLRVKENKNWRNKRDALKIIGYLKEN